jgi:hypothetical protein
MVARYYLDVAHHKRLLRNTIAVPQLYERYANTVKLSEKIIKRIDVLYKNAE